MLWKDDADSRVIVGILTDVFSGVTIYENDVPQNFSRPCLLVVRPDESTSVREVTRAIYEETKLFKVYAFDALPSDLKENIERVSSEMESTKHALLDFVIGTPKYLIPGSNRRYLTIEIAGVNADDTNCVTEFTFRTKKMLPRNLRKKVAVKINEVRNNGVLIARGKE